MRDFPKYIVRWQTDFDDESMTPQEAAVEALRELQSDQIHVDVFDCDNNRRWFIGFQNHEFEVIETQELHIPIGLPAVKDWLPFASRPR